MISAVNRVTSLVETSHIRIERFEHAAGVAHVDPDREVSGRFGVHFVDRGEFAIRTAGPWMKVSPRGVFVTAPGMEFSCQHDQECPEDRCTSVVYSEAAVESARSVGAVTNPGVRPLTNRLAYLRRPLAGVSMVDPADAETIADAMLTSLSGTPSRTPLFPGRRLSWYASRVDRAKAQMRAHYAEALPLSVLARDAGMSLFHFARTFAELEGQPPHQFLMDVRLARARAVLAAGGAVTDACYLAGFQSLSHFVTTFRRRHGVTPSRYTQRPPGTRFP